MITREEFDVDLVLFVEEFYGVNDQEFALTEIYPESQRDLFYLFLADTEKQKTRRGLPEDNPIVIPVEIFQNFFPRWKERILNPSLNVISFANPQDAPDEPVDEPTEEAPV